MLKYINQGFIFVLSWICSCILFILGWNKPKQSVKDKLSHDRLILLFPHTSYWDFYLGLLYIGAYPEIFKYTYILVEPKNFKYYGWLLRQCRCIPSTKLRERGKNLVQSIVDQFSHIPKVHILISPKGTIRVSPWRSGYYWISRGLNANITVFGLNYAYKRIGIGTSYNPRDYNTINDLQPQLQNDMKTIIPRYPPNEKVIINPDICQYQLFPFDIIILSNIIFSIFPLYYIYYVNNILFYGCVLSVGISTLYHHKNEQNRLLGFLDSILVYLSIILYVNPVLTLLLVITYFFYIMGSGREYNYFRTKKYYIHHTIFHMLSWFCIMYSLMNYKKKIITI